MPALRADRQTPFREVQEHLLASATTTVKMFTAQRYIRVTKVEYINPTGLAGHATDHWTLTLQKGSTVIATYTTDSDVVGQGTLTANAIVLPTLSSTDADLVIAIDDVVSLVLTKGGAAANLPAGHLVVHGRHVT